MAKVLNFRMYLFALISGGMITACSEKPSEQAVSEQTTQEAVVAENVEIKPIDPAGAAELVKNSEAIIVDVREPNEWDQGHIPGAMHIPVAQISLRLSELEDFRNTPVVLQCRSGVRSAQAAAKLKSAGFTQLYNLEGGILAWNAANMPTECDVAQADGSVAAGEC